MELKTDEQSLPVYEALANKTRLDIINLLSEESNLNLSQIATKLNLSNPMITKHMKKLLDARLVKIEKKAGISGIQKIVSLNIEEIRILFPKKLFPDFFSYSSSIGIGLYTDYYVLPTCGLVSPTGKIGIFDQPKYFSDNERINASMLWFSEGFIEYKIPNPLGEDDNPEVLEISTEISSEFVFSNNNWPSDVTFLINDVEIGTYTIPGNYSDVRGLLTPDWWDDVLSQYGLLKRIGINRYNTSIDGEVLSDKTIADLNLKSSPTISLKFLIKHDAKHRGGLTIFGESFGNHPQNIGINLYYSN
ncbi:transcriptional regulator [Enterococcus sp. JM4C]|uniref:ArsR/SmtB family transcription factor n=1 Tax=Candidatus Enterococcus huntleyi TaxID=1857217 RepID=UPI001379BDD7|nr:ArsR family transcriptional regulator [Enterococcus sp. JM4C]KAF1297874.1 transcriptional regulator [Enterococcus sp. JM4C]